MNGYSPESKSSGRRVKVELDLPNYATKADFQNAKVLYIQICLKKLI